MSGRGATKACGAWSNQTHRLLTLRAAEASDQGIGHHGPAMAKLDRLKEEIGWLKIVFGILVAIDASLLGWLAQNYTTASRVLVLAGVAGTVMVTFAVVPVHRLAYDRIQELEDA